METGYQRGKIQEESMHYEMLKHTGEYPIIGVNTFRNPQGEAVQGHIELARSTEEEKQSQLKRLADFHAKHAAEAGSRTQEGIRASESLLRRETEEGQGVREDGAVRHEAPEKVTPTACSSSRGPSPAHGRG